MRFRWGLGPVFYFEWLTSSRRWQMYAGRALFVLLLLAALALVWFVETQAQPFSPVAQSPLRLLARMGENFFYAIIGTQLAVVLLVAPAVTAGAICVDKARGTLLHLLTTDLTNIEIILGKLVTRLLTVFGLVLCTVPVLFICTLEGGIDPEALIGAFLIVLGIAVFAGTLALTLSVWCRKTYEVLLATYMILAVLLLTNPMLKLCGLKVLPPFWVEALNPFWLAFAPYWSPGAITLEDDLGFLGVCVALAILLAALAAWRVRAITIGQSSEPAKPRRRLLDVLDLGGLARMLPGFSVDFNPILWREWRRKRPSRWVRGVWIVYVVLSALFTGMVLVEYVLGTRSSGEMGPFVNAFQVAIGLLLVSVASVTSLAEERVQGTMDLLLTTTIPSWKIVWGKWWGTYRTAIFLAILPGVVMLPLAVRNNFYEGVVIFVGLILAYGAAVTSFGLALATWNRRQGRALALSVLVYVIVTVGWIMIVLLFVRLSTGRPEGLAIGSPWFGSGMLTAEMEHRNRLHENFGWAIGWTILYAAAAAVLLLMTLTTFNACLGRMPYVPFQLGQLLRPISPVEQRRRAVPKRFTTPP